MLAWAKGQSAAGRRREEEEPPSRRTPGASIAAIVEQARRGAAREEAAGARGAASDQAAPRPARDRAAMDADGFVSVGKGGKPTAATVARAAADVVGTSGGSGTADARAAAADRADERDGEEAPSGRRCDDQGLDDEESAHQDPAQLRQRWADEAALVRRLAKEGLPEGHPALVAAQAARDAAEAAWRSAKRPAPVATRLRWAQAKLTRALEMADATRAAIKKADDDHEKLMEQLHNRRMEDGERVRKRQLAVEELQREIGGLGTPAQAASGGDATALLEACDGLCNAVGPELAALAEQLPEGSAQWQAVNKVLATLATRQRKVEEAAGMHRPQAFDIGDADADEDDVDDIDEMSVGTPWSESHELDQGLVAAPQGPQGQLSGSVCTSAQQQGDGWGSWGQAQWHATQWRADQYGKWHRSSWADQWEAEHGQAEGWGASQREGPPQGGARRGGGEHDSESGEPRNKLRRQATGRAASADGAAAPSGGGEAAPRAQGVADAAAAGQSTTGPAGSTAFEAQVAEVVQRAIEKGVQPITEDGNDLITLSPTLLARWVAENLEGGDGH